MNYPCEAVVALATFNHLHTILAYMRDEVTNWLCYSIDFRTNKPITLKFEISLDYENDDVSSNKSRKNQDNCCKNGRIFLILITALKLCGILSRTRTRSSFFDWTIISIAR